MGFTLVLSGVQIWVKWGSNSPWRQKLDLGLVNGVHLYQNMRPYSKTGNTIRCFLFLFSAEKGLEDANPTVRWTIEHSRLDSDVSLAKKNNPNLIPAGEGFVFCFWEENMERKSFATRIRVKKPLHCKGFFYMCGWRSGKRTLFFKNFTDSNVHFTKPCFRILHRDSMMKP